MTGPTTYTKKPVDVEAIWFDGTWSAALDIFRWMDSPMLYVPKGYEHHLRRDSEKDRSTSDVLDTAPPFIIIKTLEGDMRCDLGDYVIRGVEGEFYPCKPNIFMDTYTEKEVS